MRKQTPHLRQMTTRRHGSSQTAALLVVLVSSQTIQCALVSVVALGTTLGSSYWRDINKALCTGNTATQHHTTPALNGNWGLAMGTTSK